MKTKFCFSFAVVAFLCMTLWTVYAQGQRTNPARQVWEYKSLVYAIRGTLNTQLYEDGSPLSGSATPVTRAPELGIQGWELVSVTGTESAAGTTYVYWFKRPR